MLGHRKLNVEDYLAILRRRWWLLAIPVLLGPTIGYAVTYFITPQYVSQTLVIIQQQEVPEDYVKPVVNEDLDSRIASMREQILSRSSLEPIITKYNLYATDKMSMDDRIDLARVNIGIKAIHSDIARSNGLPGFFISFKSSDARTAQSVCDEIRGLFITQNLLSRTNAVEDTTKFLLSQQAEAKNVLDDQAKKLADFQRQYAGRLPGDTTSTVNLLNTLSTQLASGTEQLSNMESNKTYMETVIAQQQQQAQATTPMGATAQTPQAQQLELDKLLAEQDELKAHYTNDYPDVKNIARKIADLRQQMAKSAAVPVPAPGPTTTATLNRPEPAAIQENKARLRALNDAIALKRREQDGLTAQIRKYQAAVESTPQVEEEFKSLTRDNQAAQANYDQLSVKINQSKMATDLERRQQGEQFKTLDPANLPDAPIYPRRIVFVSEGLGAGMAIGLLVVALLEYRDTALRSERDVWAFTQLPTLAVIAWSGDVAHTAPSLRARLKRLFSRKPKDALADATG
jgi:polysaccharide chain length determinant protein (PEP-CTERM system associated)